MIAILVLLIFLNMLVVPVLWTSQAIYCFATAQRIKNTWVEAYQRLKYTNKMWSLFDDYDLIFGSYVVGDLLCGLITLILLAFIGYWMLIPIICGAILVYLRYLNMERKDA